MRVDEIMTRSVVSLSPSNTVADAYEAFKARKIHHLLVVDHGNVIGVVSIRDVSGKRDDTPVATVMSRDIRVAEPSITIKEAAVMMMGRNSGCLPIVEHGRLIGIVTTTDLLHVLSRSGRAQGATVAQHGTV